MVSEIKIGKLDPSDIVTIRKIADCYYDEWETPNERTIKRLTSQPGEDTLLQLVLTLGNEPVATGGLCNTVNIYNVHEELKKYKPWVGLLYVRDDYRNKGYGTMLLNQLEQRAKEKDFAKIYLYTFTAVSLYKKCGWKEIDRVKYKSHETVVMEKTLK